MFAWHRRRGLTLVEILVVLAVVAVMAGILVPVLYHARGAAKLAACTSNLAQISVATKMYYEDQGGPPVCELPLALADYVDSSEVFVCPEDERGTQDSYSEFFVARWDATNEQFLVGCPRHGGDKRAAIAFGRAACEADRLLDVTWNGEQVGPGDTVTGGEMVFSDGSRVRIANGVTVGMLVSFTTHGKPYSIIWVPEGSLGSVDCSVTPGSKFEVVTPAAIAGVQGTKFLVTVCDRTTSTNTYLPELATYVQVSEGVVLLRDRATKATKTLKAGRTNVCATAKKKAAYGPEYSKLGFRYGDYKGEVIVEPYSEGER